MRPDYVLGLDLGQMTPAYGICGASPRGTPYPKSFI